MSKRLRVMIDARPLTDPRGGGVRFVAEQAVRSLLASSIEADWFFATTGIQKPKLPDWISTHPNTRHIHVGWPNKCWSLMAMFGAVALDRAVMKHIPDEEQRGKKIDKAIIFNLGFTGFIETPYALLLHDLSFKLEPNWFSQKARIWHIAVNPKELIRRADQLFSVSETTARDVERIYGMPRKEIRIVKIGTRMTETMHETGDETSANDAQPREALKETCLAKQPYLLVLGAGNPRKNVATAIKAFEILTRDPVFANLDLIIVGICKKKREERSERRGEAEISHLTSHISPLYIQTPSDEELDTLYRNASAFLCPSWYEGYSLPLHEASRFGTPCIASTDGAHHETAPEGTLFVPPSKPHLWAKAIRQILSVPNQHRTIFEIERERPDFSNLIQWINQ